MFLNDNQYFYVYLNWGNAHWDRYAPPPCKSLHKKIFNSFFQFFFSLFFILDVYGYK